MLGAPEILAQIALLDQAAQETIAGWQVQGLGVLIFSGNPSLEGLHDQAGQPKLPAMLTPIGLVALNDGLRPQVSKTIHAFAEAGVSLKIISGDNPQTVQALARQAGMEVSATSRTLTGPELDLMTDEELLLVAREATIFGRDTPKQKERLVTVLQTGGRYVAMISDGVNDVLSLKEANLGIAMESVGQATRAIAGIILLGDSYESLPEPFKEGQRIRNGMQDNLKLHPPRIGFEAMLIISLAVASLGFPLPAPPERGDGISNGRFAGSRGDGLGSTGPKRKKDNSILYHSCYFETGHPGTGCIPDLLFPLFMAP